MMACLNSRNGLDNVMKMGYALIFVALGLMIWASSVRAEKGGETPCSFNALCTCSSGLPDNYGSVRCKDVPFLAIPEALNVSKVYTLVMENTGLAEIEPHFLQATGLYRLEVSNNPLFDVDDEAFGGLERSMWELILKNNGIVRVPTKALRFLQKLRYLDLSGNNIALIERDSFRGLQNNLQTLILADNSITELSIEAFQGLPNLNTLDLSSNNLREISPDVFREQMNSLVRINFADNLLSEIPYIPLSMLKSLRFLDLSQNRIHDFGVRNHDGSSSSPPLNMKLTLEQLHLEHNQIHQIKSAAFQYFLVANQTFLDFNPIHTVGDDAFQSARIRELYMRHCRLDFIEPSAFSGLESTLQVLDMSGNNITTLPDKLFNSFDLLQTLNLKENKILTIFPHSVTFTSFQFSLTKLDMTGDKNGPTNLAELRKLKKLRSLSVGKLQTNQLVSDDFLEFGHELENLKIFHAGLRSINAHAFMHVPGIKRLDLSENSIENVERGAFQEIGHTLIALRLARGFSPLMNQLPDMRELSSLEELDVSNNKLKSIGDTFFHSMKQLRTFKASDNLLEQLPKGLFQRDIHQKLEDVAFEFNTIRYISTHTFVDLEKLHSIKLRDNRIERLERRAFMNLEKLQHLNLKGNKLTSISDEAFQNLPHLSYLDLSYNDLKTFDFDYFDQVGTLAHLSVNVSYNYLSELSDNTTSFISMRELGTSLYHSNIKVLDMSHNNISSINGAFFRPAEMSLVSLNLAFNYLQNTSREIFGNFIRLQSLDLSDNFIEYLAPDTFRNTKKLQVLNLRNNLLTEIGHDTFRNMGYLRIVDFSFNSLRFVPDNLFNSEDMEKLDVSHNQLTKIPVSSLTNLAALTICGLDLSHNNIGVIHSMDLSNKFRRLSRLDLSYNRLVRLEDAAFATLPNLAVLDLSHNSELEVYGRVFIGLETNLMELNLNNISIIQAPELALPNLRILRLSHNELPSIPPEQSANLTSLRTLDISYNDLTTVPLITHSLPNLQTLSLAGNPITSLTNTSLLGACDTLEDLDISQLPLTTIENGILNKLEALRTLRCSTYPGLTNFNIPVILDDVESLRELVIEAPVPKMVKVTSKEGFETYQHVQDSASDLRSELFGYLPDKVRSITISGAGFNRLSDGIFDGVQSTTLHVKIHNTTLSGLPTKIFQKVGSVFNISVDIDSNNKKLNTLPNPNSAIYPNQPDAVMLTKLNLHYTTLTCDCELGWIEHWQRKKRQYVCSHQDWAEDVLLKSEQQHYIDDCDDPYIDDDLRSARCSNKNSEPLLEVLKNELECGWSSAPREEVNIFLLIAFMISFTAFML